MRIAVLGPLEVSTDDGRTVNVPGAKERLLLAVLAAGSPDVVSTDRIVETLWNGDQPASARKSLQVHLVHLRSALEPERAPGEAGRYVVRRGSGYALTTSAEDIDAQRVGRMAALARGRLAAGDTAGAARLASDALALWRGEPFSDWPDAAFADAERRRLTEVRTGAVTTLLESRLALGEDPEVVAEAERALTTDPLNEEWWRLLVLALYRGGRQADAMAALARARAVLVAELGVDPGPRLRDLEAAVLAQDPVLDLARARTAPAVAVCPYKGLATYEAADAALFRGRDRAVAQLVGRLVDAPLLVVSGASGAGKSSLVRAGLVPALAAGALPGSEHWRAVVGTPGRRPLDALAELAGNQAERSPVLLVCDQFEELWAPGTDAADRTAFLDALLDLLDRRDVARCVAVLRGDHVGRLAEHAGFVDRLGSALVLVPPLTDGELREVVEGPAAAVGLTADTELVDAVLSDIAGRPAALPLLSTALVGTWERRRGNRLVLAGYLEAGGVAGALARSAEAAFVALDEQSRQSARRLFLRLADTDDGGALVRRPLPLAELDLEEGARRAVVDSFVARRLLAVDGEVLDVVHEALLTAWPRLARWLEDDAGGRAVRRHLVPAAREWDEHGMPADELYRGARLAAALDWADAAEADVTPVERRFLDASKERAETELTETRERLDREVTARRRTHRLAVGLAAVLVIALVATALAVAAQRAAERSSLDAERSSLDAERASLVADANRLAALSESVGPLDLSALLAVQGFRLDDTPETRDALLGGLVEHRRAVRSTVFTGNLFTTALGNAGRSLVIYAGLAILRWDIASGTSPDVLVDLTTTFEQDDWGQWLGGGVSPTDGRTVTSGVSGSGEPWVRVFDEDGHAALLPDVASLGGAPFQSAFTADGRLLDVFVSAPVGEGSAGTSWRLVRVEPSGGRPEEVVAGTIPGATEGLRAEISDDRSVAVVWSGADPAQATVVDLATRRTARLSLPARNATVVEHRALSTGGAVLWDDGAVTLVDRTGAVVQELPVPGSEIADVALAPDGTWGVTVGEGGVVLWDVDPGTGRWSQGESLTGHAGDVMSAEIDPSGSRLVTSSVDNAVIVWDVRPDGGFGRVQPGMAGRWPAGAPAVVGPGRLVVVPTRNMPPTARETPYDGEDTLDVAATFVDPGTGEVVDQVPVGTTVPDAWHGASAAVSADGRWVAVTSGLAATVLDARTHEKVARIELPPFGEKGLDGRPYPAGIVCCAAWSPDGSRLLLGAGGYLPGPLVPTGADQPSGEIEVVDTGTWHVVDHRPLDLAPTVLRLDDDGRRLAVGSSNSSEILVLDPTTLGLLQRVPLRVDDSMWALAFSPDGRLLAGGGESGKVHVIDTDTGQAREPVAVREFGPTTQLAWLPDGRTVVSASADGTAVLLDVERAVVRTPPLVASPDGGAAYTALLPASDDELVLVADDRPSLRYPLDPADWMRVACAVAGRDLTRAEWDRYLPGRPWSPTCSDLS